MDALPALTWSARPDGSAEFINQRWLEYTGLSAKNAQKWDWTVALHPDDLNRVVDHWRSALVSGGPSEIEGRLRRYDGEYRWFLFRASALRDQSGSVVKWFGTNTDIDDRKRAEVAERSSEASLRLVLDSIPGLVCTSTAAGDVESVNHPILDYTGKTRKELTDWTALLHPDDREAAIKCWSYALETGQPFDTEYRIAGANSSYRWFHARGLPLRDSDGRIVRWYSLFTDVEDRKRAEEAGSAEKVDFRQVVDYISGFVAVMTAGGEVEFVSQPILDYTGWTLQALQDWRPLVHPDDLSHVLASWKHSVETLEPWETEHRLLGTDGAYRWFHHRAVARRAADGHLRWYILLSDVDERVKARAELEEAFEEIKRLTDRLRAENRAFRVSEQSLRLLVDTIPGLISVMTPEGPVEHVNRQALDYFGGTLEELQRWGTSDAVHPDDLPRTIAAWMHSVATGLPFENEHRLRRADGVYRWFQARSQPLRDSDGRIVRWYMLITDIDERKRSEALLQSSQEALRNSQRKLSSTLQIATVAELSASIAHEINQPLAAVVANGHACLRWLSTDPPNVQRVREAAERIIRDGNSAADVIRRIRSLFKQAAPDAVALDVNGIVVEVITLMADEIREHGISVETNLAAGLPAVPADRVQMQQALMNLVRNAIEAMGEVSGRAKTLALSTRQPGDEILIHVRDHGCGIPHPEMIFDAFFTTKESGMGMGLAICRSIVEAHGGRLSVTSHEADGTTFTVAIPVKPDRSGVALPR